MPLSSNFHTHSLFCDGKAEPEAFVREAIAKGFKRLGFSSHAPVSFENDWLMKQEDFLAYKSEINRLAEKYHKQIDIFLSLEVDFIPGVISPCTEWRQKELDYVIGSVHFLGQFENGEHWTIDNTMDELEQGLQECFSGDSRALVKEYYHRIEAMIAECSGGVIGHFDLIKKNNKNNWLFDEADAWYRETVLKTLDKIAASGWIMEINTGGIARARVDSLFPSNWIIKEASKKKIPLVINSDAHSPDGLNGYYDKIQKILSELGVKELMVFTQDGWKKSTL